MCVRYGCARFERDGPADMNCIVVPSVSSLVLRTASRYIQYFVHSVKRTVSLPIQPIPRLLVHILNFCSLFSPSLSCVFLSTMCCLQHDRDYTAVAPPKRPTVEPSKSCVGDKCCMIARSWFRSSNLSFLCLQLGALVMRTQPLFMD